MAKLIPYEAIEKEHNINRLLSSKDIICFEICRVTSENLRSKRTKKDIIKKIEHYAKTHENEGFQNNQCGRVWFLVNETKKCSEVLQVAQALNQGLGKGYFHEIICHIEEIFEETENKYKNFSNNMQEGDSLVFYELAIDKYLEEFAPPNYKQIIYEMAREYYAEASLAHFTQAREWGFYNSGMDKRAYFNILDNVKCNQIDKQKETEV
ncbi:MAG: hypothetical protein HDR14_03290 [Lachnospiraceae bacterium]|nr:hypothetical protein [Lachnospiraceae bacterium]